MFGNRNSANGEYRNLPLHADSDSDSSDEGDFIQQQIRSQQVEVHMNDRKSARHMRRIHHALPSLHFLVSLLFHCVKFISSNNSNIKIRGSKC
eukprot:scaffold680697_cov67-Attheya_sp.AAC.1